MPNLPSTSRDFGHRRLRYALTGMAALLVLTLAGGLGWKWLAFDPGVESLPAPLAPFAMHHRPQAERNLFDYAGVLRHYEEGSHRYLTRIVDRFHIETLIVTLPELPDGHNIETLAVDLSNNWQIGAHHEGRGLLLLVVAEAKQAKLAVTYELEDVFTDSFAGYVEDLQLGPYYRAGDIGTGLIAVMEELEHRAQLKYQGDYTPGVIARADRALLAGGAGATRHLQRYRDDPTVSRDSGLRGAPSPEVAWETMLTQWGGDGDNIEFDVYTGLTRLAMGDPRSPDPRALRWLEHWQGADYQIRSDGRHAVIWFGAVDGWENAPFLFCNDGNGWKFDIVHQRRLVVMAENPKWHLVKGPYPYLELMPEARNSTAKYLPLAANDLYRCEDDAFYARRIAQLGKDLQTNPDDVEATIELARLNVITGRRPNHVHPLLKRARRMAPERPESWKYSAIYNVNAFFQYKTALADIERYLKIRPRDTFGHATKGFLLYRLGRNRDAIESLEAAVDIDPGHRYAYALMERVYWLLHRRAEGLQKSIYRDKALAIQQQLARTPA